MSTITPAPGWDALCRDVRARADRVVYLLGPIDVGKTTLARWLLAQRAEVPVALVSADPGQPAVGPPACAAMAVRAAAGETWSAPWLRFVGDVSPAGNLLQLQSAVRRLVDEALAQGAELVVVDTPGMVEGEAARVLHLHAIDVLDPDVVVAIASGEQLAPIVAPLARRTRPRVERLRPSPDVRPRSPDQRTRHRLAGLSERLADAARRELPLPLHAVHGRVPADPERARGRLGALLDRRGFVLTLAVVEALSSDRVTLVAPPFEGGDVSSLQIGDVIWTPPPR